MSEQKTKSNAPWILGIIGIFLTILHYACAIACSAGLAGLGGAAGDAEGGAKAADSSLMFGTVAAGIMFVCFILSFFRKSIPFIPQMGEHKTSLSVRDTPLRLYFFSFSVVNIS